MPNRSSSAAHTGAIVVLVGGLVALAIAVYLYITPLTGVNGSLGALLVMGASAAIAFDGLILLGATTPAVRGLWLTLGFLGAIGTLAAAYLLHAYGILAAMAIVLVALVVVTVRPPYHV